jgi:hypothetical protein
MPHKFKIGQPVEYHPPHGIYPPRGTYLVTAKLPQSDGEFEYHIRSVSEQHERVNAADSVPTKPAGAVAFTRFAQTFARLAGRPNPWLSEAL